MYKRQPLCSLLLAIILRRNLLAVRVLSLSGAALLAAVGLVLVWQAAQGVVLTGQVGGWQAPFGISLVIDRLSAVMIAISAVVALVTLLYGVAKDNDSKIGRDFHLFIQGLLTGICGAFITADIFNLYVWFEVLLIASFALMALGCLLYTSRCV